MTEWARALNALLIVILCGILLGGLGIQIFTDEYPCPLCYLQRLGMIGIAVGALLNITCGLRSANYAISLAACVFGGGVALRQIALHVCPQFSKYGEPFMGFSLYTWSFMTHAFAVLYIALLLFFQERVSREKRHRRLNWWELVAIFLLVLVVAANVAATLIQCGFGFCSE